MACEKKLDVEIVRYKDKPQSANHQQDDVELQIVHRKIEVRDPLTGKASYASRMDEVEVPIVDN